MKWIVFLMLSSSICNAQKILVDKKIIDFCNEKIETVDTLTKIVYKQDIIIIKQDSLIRIDSILITKHKLDSNYLTKISLKKDTLLINKDFKIKSLKKKITILGTGVGIQAIIIALILLL